jgi:hypothetical protein
MVVLWSHTSRLDRCGVGVRLRPMTGQRDGVSTPSNAHSRHERAQGQVRNAGEIKLMERTGNACMTKEEEQS